MHADMSDAKFRTAVFFIPNLSKCINQNMIFISVNESVKVIAERNVCIDF